MGRRITLDPARLVRARHDYECTSEPIADIARRNNMGRTAFAAMAKREGWSPRHPARTKPATNDAGATDHAGILLRIQRTVERELAAIDVILARLASEEEMTPASERTARMLASLTRTLKEVQRLRAAEAANAKEASAPDADDDDMPRDIDEFRRELARRIDAFVASRTDAGLSEPKES